MTGAELVVASLKTHGIDTVFGYPGGAIMPVYDALYDGGVEHILFRNEQGAAMGAIGRARATQSVAVCIATSGPGATNLITGLADALLDSVPVVAITGQVASPLIGTDAFQEIDVLGLSLACTKHSYLVTRAEDLAPTLAEAFYVAKSGRPGPVLVDIAKDVQMMPAVGEPAQPIALPIQNEFDANALNAAQQLLDSSSQPMLYVGGGVLLGNATDSVREFLIQSQMPVVSTLKGLGVAPKGYPYALGMVGMHGNQAANHAVQQCDLLFAIGARFDDRVTGKLDEFAPKAKVIHLDIDAAELDKLRRANAALKGEINVFLPQLNAKPQPEWQQQVMAMKQQYAWRYDHPGEPIYAPLLLKQLSDLLPNNAVVATDVGQHQMWAAQHMRPSRPENFLTSAGLGTMGFGLPAAIGAKISRGTDPVVLVSGDGSFMMNVQELGTIRRCQLPVKIVLIDNQRLGMVRQWQQLFFDARYSETYLTDNPDFVTMASAFGIDGQTITNKSQVPQALNTMLQSEGPYLLHVAISEEENVWPLVPPGAANHHMLESEA
ncbi:Acetolactate synthase isozyme 2 large subunit [Vibrio stylophorae]|uniref:Acetolactate synthase n=1 Tax=Vibrio stylophorae TaxID=659351 RepID=A0ABN8DRZ9_9VIBR|nr:acetolactate synthase 2 catalytic subunit [Vibrio stylophorae]CAH0532212.1 Acetolactate synthase isozyme 2 large subunit [Vibrio stylophorae]